MIAVVTLDLTCSEQDCVRAWRRHFKERLNLPLDLAMIAVVAAFGLWTWWIDGATVLSVIAFGLAGALGVLIASAPLCLTAVGVSERRKA